MDQPIDLWDESCIQPGKKWRKEIEQALNTAHVAVLLVSANYLETKFISDSELESILKRATDQGLTVIWIYLSPCLYKTTLIKDYQPAHERDSALSSMSDPEQEQALLEICTKIIEIAQDVSDSRLRIEDQTVVRNRESRDLQEEWNQGKKDSRSQIIYRLLNENAKFRREVETLRSQLDIKQIEQGLGPPPWRLLSWVENLTVTGEGVHEENSEWTILPLVKREHMILSKSRNWQSMPTVRASVNGKQVDILSRNVPNGAEWLLWFPYFLDPSQTWKVLVSIEFRPERPEHRCKVLVPVEKLQVKLRIYSDSPQLRAYRCYVDRGQNLLYDECVSNHSELGLHEVLFPEIKDPSEGSEYIITWN